jgi:hypothetical protein
MLDVAAYPAAVLIKRVPDVSIPTYETHPILLPPANDFILPADDLDEAPPFFAYRIRMIKDKEEGSDDDD